MTTVKSLKRDHDKKRAAHIKAVRGFLLDQLRTAQREEIRSGSERPDQVRGVCNDFSQLVYELCHLAKAKIP